MSKKNIKLYNIIFPIWIIWLIPTTWIIVLPLNFLIDLLVVVFALKFIRNQNIKSNAKKCILSVWLLGFLSDFIGTVFMFLPNIIDLYTGEWWYDNLVTPLFLNPFSNFWSFVWGTISIVISGIVIYFFNYKFSFRRTDMTEIEKKKVSIALAVFTAPYLFYLPTEWFIK